MQVWGHKERFALRFKAKKGDKKTNFELEICVKTKKGRTALQPQASLSLKCQPVKHAMLARACTSVARTETPLYAFSRAIDRESLAGLWQLPQTTCEQSFRSPVQACMCSNLLFERLSRFPFPTVSQIIPSMSQQLVSRTKVRIYSMHIYDGNPMNLLIKNYLKH